MKTLHLSIILAFLVLSSYEFNVNGQTENSTSVNSDCQSRITQKEQVLSSAVNQPKAILFAVNSNQFKSAVNGNDVNFDYVYYGWNVDKINCSATLQSVNVLFHVKLSDSVTSIVVKEDSMLGKVIEVIQSPVPCEGTCYGPNVCDCFIGIPLQQELQALYEQAPLKQFKSGIAANSIQCKDNLQLMIRNNGFPACVKPTSVEKFASRGWIKNEFLDHMNTFTLDTGKSGTFQTPYFIEGAELLNIISDVDTNSIVITLDKSEAGHLTVALPKILVDAINGQCDKNYEKNHDKGEGMTLFVIVDGEEINFNEIVDTNNQTLLIQFPENTKKIEIIRACLI